MATKEFKGTKERLNLISSGHKDYFRVVKQDSGDQLAYLRTTNIIFNEHQLSLQQIIGYANSILRERNELLEACQSVIRLRQLIEYPNSNISDAYEGEAKAINEMLNKVESAISSALGE